MNRNYLPPSLKHTSHISGSPPSNSYVMPQQRRFGRACKLPTVQEVMGKSFVSDFSLCFWDGNYYVEKVLLTKGTSMCEASGLAVKVCTSLTMLLVSFDVVFIFFY